MLKQSEGAVWVEINFGWTPRTFIVPGYHFCQLIICTVSAQHYWFKKSVMGALDLLQYICNGHHSNLLCIIDHIDTKVIVVSCKNKIKAIKIFNIQQTIHAFPPLYNTVLFTYITQWYAICVMYILSVWSVVAIFIHISLERMVQWKVAIHFHSKQGWSTLCNQYFYCYEYYLLVV